MAQARFIHDQRRKNDARWILRLESRQNGELQDEAIVTLYRQGHLELAYAHLASLENFERLAALA